MGEPHPVWPEGGRKLRTSLMLIGVARLKKKKDGASGKRRKEEEKYFPEWKR